MTYRRLKFDYKNIIKLHLMVGFSIKLNCDVLNCLLKIV